jgi:hypothetical protein
MWLSYLSRMLFKEGTISKVNGNVVSVGIDVPLHDVDGGDFPRDFPQQYTNFDG